ncbi:MAG: DUF424 family protein [Euryarchaeota archaeon]|nr:DUF424 family protein [Euryarchaeota archaeon]
MKYYAKVYRVQNEVLVAVCDASIHGRVFEEGELILDIKREFYGDEEFTEEQVAVFLKEATIANIAGEGAVGIAVKLGIIDEENVLRVCGIPHAQMVRM